MFASALTLATLALAAIAPVAAVPTTHHEHAALMARDGKNWPSKYEPYDVYHARYMALVCYEKHNTSFFKSCCGPMLKTQKLSSRPAQCTPTVGTASDDDDDCDDDDDDNSTSSTQHASSTKTTPSSTAASPPKNTPSTGSFDHQGTATWYTQDGTWGACGKKYDDNAFIVALNSGDYGSFGRVSSNCFRKILLKNDKTGKTITVTAADGCPGCGHGSLDLSVGAFKALASLDDGVFPISWKYIS